MRSNRVRLLVALAFTLVVVVAVRAQQQRQPPDPARALTGQLTSITKQVMEMAEDFPDDQDGEYDLPADGGLRIDEASGTVATCSAGRIVLGSITCVSR